MIIFILNIAKWLHRKKFRIVTPFVFIFFFCQPFVFIYKKKLSYIKLMKFELGKKSCINYHLTSINYILFISIQTNKKRWAVTKIHTLVKLEWTYNLQYLFSPIEPIAVFI